jgi:hypothetical protein
VADQLWTLVRLAAAPVTGLIAALSRYRRQQREAAQAVVITAVSGKPSQEHHLPPTTESAEREMAMLLRRMRAYLRDPYDYTASRIIGEAAFEACLDRASVLGVRIAELGGAAPASPSEHERTRGLILEGLMAVSRIAGQASVGVGARQGAQHLRR